jgi:hypothetical protein
MTAIKRYRGKLEIATKKREAFRLLFLSNFNLIKQHSKVF